MTIKWGILGTAQIARTMAPAIQASKDATLYAIASRDINKAEIFANQYTIPNAYGNYTNLLDDRDIDAVYIPLPNHLHESWVIKAAKRQKHVLCEKTFALNVVEAKNMFKICQENQILCMEAFMYRFNPRIARIKQILDNEATTLIGNIKYANFCFAHDIFGYFQDKSELTNYRFKKAQGGGALYDLGVYGVNLYQYLFGKPSKIVQSFATYDQDTGVDQTFLGSMQYDNNILCNLTASFNFYGNYLSVSGTKGMLEVKDIISQQEGSLRIWNDQLKQLKLENFAKCDHYRYQIDHFNQCILNKEKPLITSRETIDSIQTIEDLRSHSIKNRI